MSLYARIGSLPAASSTAAKMTNARPKRPAARSIARALLWRGILACALATGYASGHQPADLIECRVLRPCLPHNPSAIQHDQPVAHREQIVGEARPKDTK